MNVEENMGIYASHLCVTFASEMIVGKAKGDCGSVVHDETKRYISSTCLAARRGPEYQRRL